MLSLQNVCKRFGDLEVLRGVSVDVNRGEVVCVIGPRLGGRRCCAASTCSSPRGGSDPARGREITGKDAVEGIDFVRRRVGMVFQQFNLFPHKSALENVCIAQEKVLDRSGAAARRPRRCCPASGCRQDRRVSGPALGRPAAAGGDRPGAGDGPPRDAVRRGHLGARPGAGQGGPRRDARARRGGDDDDRRDPRDGLRPRGREPGRVHGRGRVVEEGRRPRCSATRSRSARSGSSGWCWSIRWVLPRHRTRE